MADPVVLAEGTLNWFTYERITDRYGAVHIKGERDKYAGFAGAPTGCVGSLVAYITESRPSFHIGDIARGVGPSGSEVGEQIVLGTGTLFTYLEEGIPVIGVEPADGRESDWMDPRSLYRCHNQTVRLEFVHMPAEPLTPEEA